VEVEPPLSPNQAKVVLLLSERHGLTVYDAAYLELAVRKGLALATTDNALLRAAPSEGVVLMDRP
jgi:predicted nucleic acid-binding protein